MLSFREKVLKIVSEISQGEILTYKQVAIKAGNSNAARAVGSILKTNYNKNIPCHRVICSNGNIGGYNRGVKNKLRLLKKEKVF